MDEIQNDDNYSFGKLSEFSKKKISIADFLLIKAAVFLKDPEDPESIESIRENYKSLESHCNEIYTLKQTLPNLYIPEYLEKIRKLLPIWEQMPEKIRLISYASFLYVLSIENTELKEHFMSGDNIVLKAFGKSPSQIRAEFIADPFAKPIILRLEKDLQSEDPVRRVIASYQSLQGISNMAKALPDELNNEPLPKQTEKADEIEETAHLDEIGFDTSGVFVLPIDWDVLVSASDSCLDGYAPGFVEKEIIKQLPASITYRLWQEEYGELGTVEIRKNSAGFSQIDVSGVGMNSADNAKVWLDHEPEWRKKINDAMRGLPDDEAIYANLEVSEQRDRAKARIEAKKKNHQANVIKAYFNRLVHEVIWTTVTPPGLLYNFVNPKELERIWPHVSSAFVKLNPTSQPAPANQPGQVENWATIAGLSGQTTIDDIVRARLLATTSIVNSSKTPDENDAARFRLARYGNVSGQVVNPQQRPVRSQDIRIAKRREKVKELSESGESIENIARNQSVSVATIVRDREYLGIATKREKPQP